MSDDIELPPLPSSLEGSVLMLLIRDYTAQAIRADRERRAKQEAKPVVHSTTLRLCPDGYAWRGTDVEAAAPGYGVLVDLRWTADGRAWIDSERNRELAARMRAAAGRGFTSPTYTDLLDVADALDGGER